MNSLQEIQEALKQKSPADVKQVLDLCLALQSQIPQKGVSRDEQLFCDAMSLTVSKNSTTPVSVVLKSVGRKEVQAGVQIFKQFLVTAGMEKTSVIERGEIYNGLMKLVANYLRRVNVPVSYVSLSRNVTKVDELFELAFPGYAESNLAAWALKIQKN